MKTTAFGLLLPAIMILHNTEEYRSFERFKNVYLKSIDEKLRKKSVFLYALAILTISAAGICVANYFIGSRTSQIATTLVMIALLFNGVQHCTFSLWYRKMLPGTVSGLFLMIPYSLIYLILLENEIKFGFFDFVSWSLLSIIFMILLIRISFRIGYFLHSFSKR